MASRRLPLPLFVVVILAGATFAGCLEAGNPQQTTQPGEQQAPKRGDVEGVVHGLGGPLSGARVEISRIFGSTTTDTNGRFFFTDLLATDYRLTVTADHHRRSSQTVHVQGDGNTPVQFTLNPIMLTQSVPALYGKQETVVSTQDTLFASLSIPGILQHGITNHTLEATFPGFWEIEPPAGYKVVQIGVIIVWNQLPEIDQGLGLHYFRGESLIDNEIVEGHTTGYHLGEPAIETETIAYYLLQNDDWEQWGKRNWQIGVYVKDDDGPAPAGAAVEHIINIVVTYVQEGYTGPN